MKFSRKQPIETMPQASEESLISKPIDLVGETISPYEFIDKHREGLTDSARSWKNIISSARELDKHILGTIFNGFNTIHRDHTHESPELDEKYLKRVAADSSIFSLSLARYQSDQKLSVRNLTHVVSEVKRDWMSIGDKTLVDSITVSSNNYKQLLNEQIKISLSMDVADKKGNVILSDFADTYLTSLDAIDELAEVLNRGGSNLEPLFLELQHIVATDWYRPDPSDSFLKNAVVSLKKDPKNFAETFSQNVMQVEQSNKFKMIRTMARFAVLASQQPVTNESMAKALLVNYPYWDEIEGISFSFQSFVNEEIKDIEITIKNMIGDKQKHNIRIIPSRKEIDVIRHGISFGREDIFSDDRSAKRKIQRTRERSNAVVLPSIVELTLSDNDLTEQAQNKARKLMLTKIRPGGLGELVEVELVEVPQLFKMDYNAALKEDISSMIDWLLANPLSKASRILHKKSGLRIAGDNLKLWRFAPSLAPTLRVKPENRYTRIVYVFNQDSLGLIDVSTHEDYNKKWA